MYADFWVFVDGQVRFKRREINAVQRRISGRDSVRRERPLFNIGRHRRRNGISWDWIMFGDPRLELARQQAGEEKEEHRQ